MKQRGEHREPPVVQLIGGDDPPEKAYEDRRRWILPVALPFLTFLALIFAVNAGIGRTESTTTTIPAEPMSEPEGLTVDARTADAEAPIHSWTAVPLDLTTRLTHVEAEDGHFVAVGYDRSGAGLWTSPTGAEWSLTSRLEVPDTTDDSASAALSRGSLTTTRWHDQTMVFGVIEDGTIAVWADGDLLGFVDSATDSPPLWMSPPIGATDLLALFYETITGEIAPEGTAPDTSLMVSTNGTEWEAVSPIGIRADGVSPITWIDGYFYASGKCAAFECLEALYRSQDGVEWAPVSVETPGATESGIHISDIVGAGDTMLAVGARYLEPGAQPGIWRSRTGDNWSLVPLGDEFTSAAVAVQLVSVDEERGTTTVAVDGVEYDLPEGSVIETDAGRVEIIAVVNNKTRVGVGSRERFLRPGDALQVTQRVAVNDIEASGPRVAVSGSITTTFAGESPTSFSATAIWISEDGGLTWEQTTLGGDDSGVESMAVTDDRVVALGSENGAPRAWVLEFASP